MKSYIPILLLALLASLLAVAPPQLPVRSRVGEISGGQVLVPTGQLLVRGSTLAALDIPGRPVDLALSPDRTMLAVLKDTGVDLIDLTKWSVVRSVSLSATSYLGLVFSPDGRSLFTSRLAKGEQKQDQLVRIPLSADEPMQGITLPNNSLPAGLAISGRFAYVCLNRTNVLAQVDLQSGEIRRTVTTGVAPLFIIVLPSGKKAYVSNWGGELAKAGEQTADSVGTPVRVDARGVASSGSVSVIDMENLAVEASISVGLHPSGMALRPDGKLLAVANANSDSVSLIDPATDRVVDTLRLAPLPGGAFGSSPSRLLKKGRKNQ
jgi:YVTN family beta-propeller protein